MNSTVSKPLDQSFEAASPLPAKKEDIVFAIIGAISFSHLLNDMIQSLILAIYPLLKDNFALSFGQIGLITLTYQFTASLLQPIVGYYTDKYPQTYALPVGMGFTLGGLVMLAFSPSFGWLLVASALVGCGSSVFHPESSRVARMASGGRHGLAQSLFQVGGNAGSSLGPLLAALIIMRHGQRSIAWFAIAALVAIVVLIGVSNWFKVARTKVQPRVQSAGHAALSNRRIALAMGVLLVLIFSKYFYLASLNSYYTFYLIDRFHLPVETTQFYLFAFLFAIAVGTIVGGPIGDRFGRKYVIWASILGVAPFTLLLPYVNLFWTGVLTVVIGLILASAFSAIIVYAQELIPGKVGMVAGMFFGFAFGVAGIGAAVLGHVADSTSIETVYKLCGFLPLLGIFTVFLPNLEGDRPRKLEAA
ncbi:MFS transporter [Pararobbsia alpina]|uniref:Fosmidomycin resistance protein n=1 Tax=Pararobbsia alpina TaxID=621374 RepID=A0A6S7B351_9BURK|nr:MFS transporter [Pararobbsia alpina]CAB3786072.1 Fosmidomycin resistance protein [Pararobbsia alpina]